jgi:hypothetical protein
MGTLIFLHFTALNGAPVILTKAEHLDEQLKDKELQMLQAIPNYQLCNRLQPQLLQLTLQLRHLWQKMNWVSNVL